MKDLITVIVPVYKVEEYINRCIDSIINQTYRNLEIILVDDGSPDKCGDICDEYAKKDKRVKVIHKENGGLSDARNAGIEIARGEYITFVDSDDWIELQMIDLLYEMLNKYNYDISIVSYNILNNEKDNINETYDLNNNVTYDSKSAILELFKEDSFGNYAWNKMYKAELFDDIRFPVGKKMEDLGTTYILFKKTNKIIYNPAKLYHYYQRDNSILHKIDSQLINDKFELAYIRYSDLKKYLNNSIENEIFMFNLIVDNYIFLNEANKKEADVIIKKIKYHEIKGCLNYKKRIKYLIFIKSKKMYYLLFNSRRKESDV